MDGFVGIGLGTGVFGFRRWCPETERDKGGEENGGETHDGWNMTENRSGKRAMDVDSKLTDL
jgi:hypothetical protein